MSLRIREFSATPEDFSAVVEIDNLCDPEHPTTVEEFRYAYETFDTTKYVLRYYLAEKEGRVVGYACYHHMPHRFHPQHFWIWVAVRPEFRRQGLGSTLYELILSDLRKLSAKSLHTVACETWTDTIRFLEKRGFKEAMRTWESHLDVTSFDFRPFEKYLAKIEREGITIVTLSEEKEREPQWLSKLHELYNILTAAAGIKMANPKLTVIAESGDGDLYGEGGNHLIHNIRRNLDITVIAHDNRVYGLTKGQASPTAPMGYTTRAQPFGVLSRPFNPLALAIVMGAGFVAQSFSGEVERTAELIARAVRYKGFALVNVLHPCPSWNRVQTFAWYKERLWPMEEAGHNPQDRFAALSLALSAGERIPVGVLFEAPPEPTWEERHPVLRAGPLVGRPLPRPEDLEPLLAEFL